MAGSLASPAQILGQQMGLPQAVLAAQAPGLITGLYLEWTLLSFLILLSIFFF